MPAQSRVLGRGRKLSYAAGPKLREALFEDYERIALLASRHRMPVEPFEQWTNLWKRNPAYTAQTPIGWVLHHENEIVGWFANIPLHYTLYGDLLRTATPRSWVVDEPFRAHAALLADAFFSQKNIDLVISTTGNEKSTPVFAALGGIPVPQTLKREAAFWITDYAGFSAAYLRLKKIPQPGVLKYPLAGAIALRQMLTGSYPRGRTPQRRLQFDCEYDKFWGHLQRSAKVLIGRRDAAALNWHFGTALQSGAAWLFDCRTGSRVNGYGIFLRYDHYDIGLKRMVLADYQDAVGGESQLPGILMAALFEARRERIHTLEISGSRLEQSDFVQKLAPHKRVMSHHSMAYQYKTFNDRAQVLANEARWDLALFDGDSSLRPIVI
jgi:hypothetical protein